MKNITVGSILEGFILKQKEYVSDINSDVLIFEHEKTGAKLMHIGNDDDNKSFVIGFKTPPTDNTGVMHILEHSVLCGSKKYPVKEPFVELCKGSMNTFLNAMTYSDKTVYPIASRNEKDYFNLMAVYLDAVFYPNIYNNENIFKQEGWHYHIESKDDEIEYKGVVYNEMKGAYSSPMSYINDLIEESLFPDNAYKYDAGGFPAEIPRLTYENYINTHKKLYHPSNSYIYLYGDLDLKKALKLIDNDYLSNFEKTIIDTQIKKQKPFGKIKESIHNYSVSNNEKLENQTYFALSGVIDYLNNPELNLAMHILCTLLIESEEAPLKQALIDAGLGNDVLVFYNDEVLQPYLSLIITNSAMNKKDKFVDTVKNTLKEIVNKGINKELIEGCINLYEFSFRECDFDSIPKGLYYSLSSMGLWIHNENPVEKLKFEEYFKNIKKSLSEPYFENIIKDYLLNNKHTSLVVLEPKLDLNIEESKNLKEQLQYIKNSCTTTELEFLVKETRELLEYQKSEDSQEDLKKIPMLSLEDIDNKVEDLIVTEYKVDGIKILHHEVFSRGIDYISYMFDTRNVKEENLQYVGLLLDLLTRVGTNNKDYISLSNNIMKITGDFYVCSNEYTNLENYKLFTPYIEIIAKMISTNTQEAINLILEVAKDTSFEDEKRIKELIREKVSELEMSIVSNGKSLALAKMSAYYNPVAKYNQKISGLEYYKFLKDLSTDIDKNMSLIKSKLYEVKNDIFNVNNLIISHIGSKNDLRKLMQYIKCTSKVLNNEPVQRNIYTFEENILNEGLIIPSEVQYVAQGYNYKKLGYKYNGSMEVLKNILRYGYLWDKIRVQGGAYGAIFNISQSGNVLLCSYRDPNIRETIQVYKEMPKSIKDIDINKRELDKAIIGTLSDMQLPTSTYKRGRNAISLYLLGKTKNDRKKQRDEILNTTVESLKELAVMMENVIDKNCIAVAGNEKIYENKELFNNIYDPLNI